MPFQNIEHTFFLENATYNLHETNNLKVQQEFFFKFPSKILAS
jgi:hypothetical protein